MQQTAWGPTSIHPGGLIGRQDERTVLREDVLAFLERSSPSTGSTWVVIGDKGVSKSELARVVLEDVRGERHTNTMIVRVDCRGMRSWREALARLCWVLAVELHEQRRVDSRVVSEEAPVALVLSTRRHFSRILSPRMVNPPVWLESHSAEELLEILNARNRLEDRAAQAAFARPEALEAVRELARLAPTVGSFLAWVHFLYRSDRLSPSELDRGFSSYVHASHALLGEATILRVMRAFETPATIVGRERILEACDGRESMLCMLEDMQVVLPEDFWWADAYGLDPHLQTFHPRLVTR